jgi:adenylate cyclase
LVPGDDSGEPAMSGRSRAEGARFWEEALDRLGELAMLDRFRAEGATDYFALQSTFGRTHRLGPANRVLTSWLTDAPGGFDDAQLALIEQVMAPLALAVKASSTYRIASSVIETYLGKDAGRRVLSGTIERGAGETIRAALWFCDLQGFTKLSDAMPRDQLLALMHEYFECMVGTIEEHVGHVLKFMGDGLLAIFNRGDDAASCQAALAAADRVVGRLAEVTARRQAQGLPVTRFSIGLHLGDVLYGNIGAPNRLDFTVVGPAVNEVSRIEAMCRALDQEIIVSAAFAAAAGDSCDRLVSLGRYVLRGVRRPQELFTLVPPDA